MEIKEICILGMGYVGLTISVIMAENGFKVTGIDSNEKLVEELNSGNPHFHEVGLKAHLRKQLNGNLFISKEMPKNRQDAFILCVGSQLDQNRQPTVDYVRNSAHQVKGSLDDNSLVIVRSTVPIGVTRNLVKPILDQSDKKYYLAFCPERTIEGRALAELKELPQVIGGIDEESVEFASRLFSRITNTIVRVSSLEAAEMIKLTCNTYRDLNFAYANELALICEKLNLNPIEVIRSANIGYERSQIAIPGFVGGSCLEKDPRILNDVVEALGFSTKLIKYGRDINEMIPNYLASKINSQLQSIGKDKNSKIFVSGIAFKGHPETDDVRASPTLYLVERLKKLGYSNLHGHDFVVNENKIGSLGIKQVSLLDGFSNADCAIIANNHKNYYNLDILEHINKMNKPALLVDVWSIYDPKDFGNDVLYCGIGR